MRHCARPRYLLQLGPVFIRQDQFGSPRFTCHAQAYQGTIQYAYVLLKRYTSASSAVFGATDGSKRWSPGYVTKLDSDSTFEHDCSTLGGSSGSGVFTTREHRVIGLHMGARDVDEVTGEGAANRALHFALLPEGREREILKRGKV
jgi:V8-like Glu-specific endopeptidase